MRTVATVIVLAAWVFAVPPTVVVSGPLYTPGGAVANGGTVSATLTAVCVVGSETVVRGPHTIAVSSNGTLTMNLVPTALCVTPGNSYSVRYRLTRGGVPLPEYTETWLIPSSPANTTIAAVRSATVPSPLAAVSWTQLTGLPAAISIIANSGAPSLSGITISNVDQSVARIRIQNTGFGGGSYDVVAGQPNVSQSGLSIYDNNVGATRVYIDNGGNVGIGGAAGAYRLRVVGSLSATAFYTEAAAGATASGGTCTVTAVAAGLVTGVSCVP